MTYSLPAKKRHFFITVWLFTMACLDLAPFLQFAPNLRKGYQDFAIYYTSGLLIREGRSAELYDLNVQYREQLTFAEVPIRQGALPFNHPPFETLLFVPLTFLGFWPAYVLWTLLSLTMLSASVILLRRFPGIRKARIGLLGLGALAFFPLTNGLLQGQDAVLLMLLTVLALTCLERGADAAAGAWLGAGLFRPHMVVVLAFLLATRRWRVLLGFVAVAVALTGFGVAVMGWRWPVEYLRFVLSVERGVSIESRVVPNLRGLVGVLVGHFSRSAAGFLILASSLAVFGLALRRIRRGNDSMSYVFCLATVTGLLLSFHAFSYDLTILLPLILFLLGAATEAKVPHDDTERLLILSLLFLTPLHVYLVMRIKMFSLFGLVVLWLFVRLLRMRAPAADPG